MAKKTVTAAADSPVMSAGLFKRKPLVRMMRHKTAEWLAAAKGMSVAAAAEIVSAATDAHFDAAITKVGLKGPGDGGGILDALTNILDWVIANQDKIQAVIDIIMKLIGMFG